MFSMSKSKLRLSPFFIVAVLFLLVFIVITPDILQSQSTKENNKELERGKLLFEGQCARCHGMTGAGGTGPSLKRIVLRSAPDDTTLFSVIKNGIPGRGMPETWQRSDNEIRRLVRYVRSLGRQAVGKISGDATKGQIFYKNGDCAKCHIVHGTGKSLGPELTDIGARRGADFLRNAVLHPGLEMSTNAEGYFEHLVVHVVKGDGQEIQGMRINEDTFTIQLRTAENHFLSYRKGDLKELRKEEQVSLMPSYLEAFSTAEVEDLIAYLASLRGQQ